MLPLAIPAIASVAGSAVQAWNKIASAREATKTQSQLQEAKVDFSAVLTQANATAQGQAPLSTQQIKQLAALPEVQAALASSAPGARVNFTISGQGLCRVAPDGTKQAMALSAASQDAVRGVAAAMSPGAASSVTLVA